MCPVSYTHLDVYKRQLVEEVIRTKERNQILHLCMDELNPDYREALYPVSYTHLRIRFMTSHPKDLSDELIETMAKSKKVCHHLHLPMQSGSSRILKIMNRRYDKEKYLELVQKIRTAIPDISLTTRCV